MRGCDATGAGLAIRTDTGPGGDFGRALCGVGDVTGDGVPDYAASAPALDTVVLKDGASGATVWTWQGLGGEFGASLALLGDQDGDGSDEILIGAPRWEQDRGAVFIYSVRGGVDSLGNPYRNRLLAMMRGTEPGERFGHSLTRVGDMTGDRRDEFG